MKTYKYKGKKIKIPNAIYLIEDPKTPVFRKIKPLKGNPVSGEGPANMRLNETPLSLPSRKLKHFNSTKKKLESPQDEYLKHLKRWGCWCGKIKPLHLFEEPHSLILRQLNQQRELIILDLLRKVFSENMVQKIIKDKKKYVDLMLKMGLKIVFYHTPSLNNNDDFARIIIGSYSKNYVEGEGEIIHEIKGVLIKI